MKEGKRVWIQTKKGVVEAVLVEFSRGPTCRVRVGTYLKEVHKSEVLAKQPLAA